MKTPTISVVIPCHNASASIGETLESVFIQTGVRVEVIVVDDGSVDESAAIVRARHQEVKLIQTPNRGASAARDLGTSAASAELIQYLDADDLLAPEKLRAQAERIEETGADVVYGDWARFTVDRAGKRQMQPEVVRQLSTDPEIDLFTADFWAPPAVYLLRRSVVDKVGQWHPRLPVIQDARFILDCARAGARFAYCERCVAYYRTHENGSLSTSNRQAFLRDCLLNAQEIYEFWRNENKLDEAHCFALARAFDHVAIGSFVQDPATFTAATELLERVMPNYVAGGQLRRLATRLLGYRRAVAVGHEVRRWRGAFSA